ncbi:MAG: hypothetical protein JOZ14_14930 [Acidobacteria bacterium]|nr:hypothetical protein [Acidobacteriota bacterium]
MPTSCAGNLALASDRKNFVAADGHRLCLQFTGIACINAAVAHDQISKL